MARYLTDGDFLFKMQQRDLARKAAAAQPAPEPKATDIMMVAFFPEQGRYRAVICRRDGSRQTVYRDSMPKPTDPKMLAAGLVYAAPYTWHRPLPPGVYQDWK